MTIKVYTPNEYKEFLRADYFGPPTKSAGNLTLFQFFDLLFYVLDIEKPNLILAPAYPQYLLPDTEDYKRTMDNPTALWKDTITYMVIREEPHAVGGDKQPFGSGKREVTQRVREITGSDSVGDKSRINYGQFFDTLVQFDVWCLTNYEVERMMVWFKRFMATHRQFFKHMGLGEILFWWRGRDNVTSQLDNKLHFRSIVYYIKSEELSYEEDYNLKELEIQLNTIMK